MEHKLDLFQAIAKRMSWLGQRQNVLSQNVANADTPNYVPQDLKEGPFARQLQQRLAPEHARPIHGVCIVRRAGVAPA